MAKTYLLRCSDEEYAAWSEAAAQAALPLSNWIRGKLNGIQGPAVIASAHKATVSRSRPAKVVAPPEDDQLQDGPGRFDLQPHPSLKVTCGNPRCERVQKCTCKGAKK